MGKDAHGGFIMNDEFFSDETDMTGFEEYQDEIIDIDTVNIHIEKLFADANLPVNIAKIKELAPYLNMTEISERAPWVYKFFEIDWSLGPCGFAFKFDMESKPRTYGFYQLLKYNSILRPIKYVYMPFGMSACPAGFSRDIAQNACAFVEMCMKNLFFMRNLRIHPKAMLGTMLYKYPNEFDTATFGLIESLNRHVYGKTKHEFDVGLPRKQLLTLSESLAVYLICRVIGLKLLQEAGVLEDIKNQVTLSQSHPEKVVIGQEWFV